MSSKFLNHIRHMVNLCWTIKTTNALGGRQVGRLSTPLLRGASCQNLRNRKSRKSSATWKRTSRCRTNTASCCLKKNARWSLSGTVKRMKSAMLFCLSRLLNKWMNPEKKTLKISFFLFLILTSAVVSKKAGRISLSGATTS